MNSKQRVLAVLNGELPDRVPFAEFAVDFDTVEKILGHETYLRAKAKSQIAFWEGRHDEVAESWRKDHIELHEKLELDIVTFTMATHGIPPQGDDPPRKTAPDTWEDRHGRVYVYSPVTEDITCVHDPVEQARAYTIEMFEGEPVPHAPGEQGRAIVDAVVQRFADEKFVCTPDGGECGMPLLGGRVRGMMTLVEQPELARAFVEHCLQSARRSDDAYIHPRAHGVLWGADFGYKNGTFINPTMFREVFKPAIAQRVAHMHARGLKVLKHCCGNVLALLDDFVDVGYDAYQSIQSSAGMDLARVKARIGDKVTLWGGVALENLVSGTPQQVRADVRRAMELAKPRGRFILGSSHSIAVGTRYDNVMAMLDEYHKRCWY